MGRIHLFEFSDQRWCPGFIRETTTDFLAAFYRLKNVYEPALRKIGEVMEKTHETTIVDCCSGSGGPILQLREYLDKNGKEAIRIILTDKHPNHKLFEQLALQYPDKVVATKNSVDATSFPLLMTGMRTFFSAFHHFKPEDALKILQDAVNNKAPIGIFECTRRHPLEFIQVLLSPIFLLVMLPFAKALTFKKFFFTYILPITPLTHMWEYFVSNLRTYSSKELQALVNQLDAPSYHWEVGTAYSYKAKSHITYLVGYFVTVYEYAN